MAWYITECSEETSWLFIKYSARGKDDMRQKITQTDEKHIKTVGGANDIVIILPCGRCGEFMNVLEAKIWI
jgi:cytidine deaminase